MAHCWSLTPSRLLPLPVCRLVAPPPVAPEAAEVAPADAVTAPLIDCCFLLFSPPPLPDEVLSEDRRSPLTLAVGGLVAEEEELLAVAAAMADEEDDDEITRPFFWLLFLLVFEARVLAGCVRDAVAAGFRGAGWLTPEVAAAAADSLDEADVFKLK